MSDEPEEEEAKPESGPPPPPKAKTPFIVLLLLIINIGGTGYLAFQNLSIADAAGHAASAAAEEFEKHLAKLKEHAAAEKAGEVGPVTPLEPFIVNLNEPDATRYLKATFELEVSESDVVGQLDKLKRPIRDDVLRYLSSLSVADTQGEAGKAKIQQEVVARIDRQLGGGRVKRMFIVEFVVQ